MSKRELVISSIINLALVVLGLMLVFSKITAIDIVVDILGIGITIAGLFGLVSVFVSKTKEGAAAVLGAVVLLIAGILLMIFSAQLSAFLMVLIPIVIGIWALISGVTNVARALQVKKLGSVTWWIPLATAVIYIILAIIIITNIGSTAGLFSTLVGIFFIIMGVLGLCNSGMSASYIKKYNIK